MAPHTRPRPTSIDRLPDECEGIVAWAAQELANTPRSQTEVYAEFKKKLSELKSELGLVFTIPAFSSFNRHNIRLAKLAARQRRAQMIANSIIVNSDGQDADKLTQASVRMLRTLIVEMMEGAADGGFEPKEAHQAAAALYRLSMAENVSTARRQKVEAEFNAKVEEAVDTVARVKGLTRETVTDIKSQILGVGK